MTIEQRLIHAAYGNAASLMPLLPLLFKNPNNLNRIKRIAYKRYGLSSNVVIDSITEIMRNYETLNTSNNSLIY